MSNINDSDPMDSKNPMNPMDSKNPIDPMDELVKKLLSMGVQGPQLNGLLKIIIEENKTELNNLIIDQIFKNTEGYLTAIGFQQSEFDMLKKELNLKDPTNFMTILGNQIEIKLKAPNIPKEEKINICTNAEDLNQILKKANIDVFLLEELLNLVCTQRKSEEKGEDRSTFIDDTRSIGASNAINTQYGGTLSDAAGGRRTRTNVNIQENFVMEQNYIGTLNTTNVPVAQDSLNPTLLNSVTRLVHLDSRYRTNIYPQPASFQTVAQVISDPNHLISTTNYKCNLSSPVKNAISMQLHSISIPYNWYNFDHNYGNLKFYIQCSGGTPPMMQIEISACNYTPQELALEISHNSGGWFNDVCYNTCNGKFDFSLNWGMCAPPNDISLIFYDPPTSNNTYPFDKNSKENQNLGWNMGFRNIPDNSGLMAMSVTNGSTFSSDTIVSTKDTNYLVISIEDFQTNVYNQGMITVENELFPFFNLPEKYYDACGGSIENFIGNKPHFATIDNPRRMEIWRIYAMNQILAQRGKVSNRIKNPTTDNMIGLISLNLNNFKIGDKINLLDSAATLYKRRYFGPVDLKKFKVKLYDDRGNLLNLNNSDWSMTLLVDHLYQY
jgi:hypothetical protein